VANQVAPRRAEHPSLEGYLRGRLTDEQLARPLLVSFSQWDITTRAVAEIAATLHEMGQHPTVALWANDTLVKDVGWSTSRGVSKLLRSSPRDVRVEQGLRALGLPSEAFARPPIAKWAPQGEIPQVNIPHRTGIRALTYRGTPMGRAILQVNPDRETPVTDEFLWPRNWVDACARSYAYAFDQALALMQKIDATCIIVFNGRFLHDFAAGSAGETLGLPVLSYDFGGNDTDFDLTIDATHDWSALQRRMLTMYEHWPSPERDEIGSQWFVERMQHVDPRNSLFVESQVIGEGIGKEEGTRIIGFFSSSGDEISELDLDWAEYFHNQPEALKSIAEICRDLPNTKLLVRTHPHLRVKPRLDVRDWHAAVEAAGPDIHLDEFSPIDSYTLMRQVDVVVTYGSTTGVEAGFAKRPVVVLGPSAYDELGCAVRPQGIEGLRQAIEQPSVGSWEGAVAYGLMMRRRGFLHKHVTSTPDGRWSLGGVPLDDASPTVLKVSDVLGRWQRRRLTK